MNNVLTKVTIPYLNTEDVLEINFFDAGRSRESKETIKVINDGVEESSVIEAVANRLISLNKVLSDDNLTEAIKKLDEVTGLLENVDLYKKYVNE